MHSKEEIHTMKEEDFAGKLCSALVVALNRPNKTASLLPERMRKNHFVSCQLSHCP